MCTHNYVKSITFHVNYLRICCTPVVTADSVTRQPFCSLGRKTGRLFNIILFIYIQCTFIKGCIGVRSIFVRKEGRKEIFYLTTHSTHFIYGYMREREMFYLTTHSTHFIYGYMASDIWLRTILIVRKETRCRHIGYSYRLTARVLLYAPSHIQDNTYHGLCYTSRGALAGTSGYMTSHIW